ncbi:hypothetical protein FFWV33_12695 [Flavobacterium faecale]|uniref:MepB family protein n=1 Tax=Flavobacterium faecale TaxID=1355330 RepID=A0A2S1LF06_9FLAO|nr:MepB family protein [Flavobacterium faecale]AWG22317.1 hypothetical protein FFWV33_12695 [Flavobacterium faecale]
MTREIKHLDEVLFNAIGLSIAAVQAEVESTGYSAHTFLLGELSIKFRVSKITPTKTGQFVTLWKRNSQGITTPHSIVDPYDFYIIAAKKDNQIGYFIFPKTVLHDNAILSGSTKKGKCGFRVYPTWDQVNNQQAKKTQIWQYNYFIDCSNNSTEQLQKVSNLLSIF